MDRKWTGNAKNCLKHDIRSSREYANKYVSERELEHHVTSPAEGHMIPDRQSRSIDGRTPYNVAQNIFDAPKRRGEDFFGVLKFLLPGR